MFTSFACLRGSLYTYLPCDGLDLEVQAHQGEDQALEVLHEVVEDAQPLGVFALLDLKQRADLGGGEGDVVVPDHDLKLLAANPVRLGPVVVVLFHDLALLDYPLDLFDHSLCITGGIVRPSYYSHQESMTGITHDNCRPKKQYNTQMHVMISSLFSPAVVEQQRVKNYELFLHHTTC
eukprot:scaffold168119_cov23-Prasinocladus_malaysianus.AAC.1